MIGDSVVAPNATRAERKHGVANHFDVAAGRRAYWRRRNAYYHRTVDDLVRRFVPPGASVLVVGSSTGDLLPYIAADPGTSLGIDISASMVRTASERHEKYRFELADAEAFDVSEIGRGHGFDYIVLQDVVGYFDDVQACLRSLRTVANPGARMVITYYSQLWEPVLKLGERLGWKMPQQTQNWLSMIDVQTMLTLAGWRIAVADATLLVPKPVPLVARFLNAALGRVAALKTFALVQYFLAELEPVDVPTQIRREQLTVSVIVPCRNERGNILPGIARIPAMGAHTEIIFVDGDSTDGTVEEIEAAIERYRGSRDIRLIHQVERSAPGQAEAIGKGLMLKLGKGDAVRKGFAEATGDIVMILDSDLTVAPEELPKFFYALAENRATFANGCRLVYPMEEAAMRFINLTGNKAFSLVFSWLLGQYVKDTLCGTKALFRADYNRIAANRSYFGEFDPFGDFDLLFGAAKLQLHIADVAIRYRARTAGASKVTAFKHGLLLLRMTWIGFKRFKLRLRARS